MNAEKLIRRQLRDGIKALSRPQPPERRAWLEGFVSEGFRLLRETCR